LSATNDAGVKRYALPGVPNPLLPGDIANKAYVDASGGASMGDLEFLRDKELSGDLITLFGKTTLATPVTLAAVIPAVGKTFFVSNGKMSITGNGSGVTQQKIELQNDGTTMQITEINFDTLNDDFSMVEPLFIKSDSLVGDGVKEYRIQKVTGAASPTCIGVLEGWIQDT